MDGSLFIMSSTDLYEKLPLCEEMLDKDCYKRFDAVRCGVAVDL